MTFEELALYEAVHDVYRTVDGPRSSSWTISDYEREKICRLIQDQLPLANFYSQEQMLKAWDLYGKSPRIDGGEIKRLELTVLVSRAHGSRCFYRGRGLGECSNEISIDRILPGSRGGRYTLENCLISCSFHNAKRNDKNLEEFIGVKL